MLKRPSSIRLMFPYTVTFKDGTQRQGDYFAISLEVAKKALRSLYRGATISIETQEGVRTIVTRERRRAR